MQKIFLIITGIVFFLNAGAQSPKRGLCGDASKEDLAAFAPYISWYYDWGVLPPEESEGQLSGIEWVPMQWGSMNEGQRDYLLSVLSDTLGFLLGFNEPNFQSQANLTPTQAAAMWPYLEQVADAYNLAIVAPATNWCGDCVDGVTSDPTDWMDKFIAACPDCRYDYVAFHSYAPNVGGLQYMVDIFTKYNKPIWITEFAPWDPPKPDYTGVVNYMINAVEYLENEPKVFRYSWFATRVASNPDIDLLGENGELTKLGELYAAIPYDGSPAGDQPPLALLQSEMFTSFSESSGSATVQLYGIAYDPNDDPITIEWTMIEGEGEVDFSNDYTEKPTVTGLQPGTYVFQMTVTANGKSDNATITVYVNSGNIAQGKPATASSVQDNADDLQAGFAVDGDQVSRWSSEDSDPQWLQIDLQDTYVLTGVSIKWEAAFSKIYSIEVSNDGENWETAYSTTSGQGGTEVFSINDTARYVRMYSTQRNVVEPYWGTSIYEFEIYGTLTNDVNDTRVQNKLLVYPNPFKNEITIENIGNTNHLAVNVLDYTGKLVFNNSYFPGNSNLIIDLGELNSGIYMVQINMGDMMISKTMIKE